MKLAKFHRTELALNVTGAQFCALSENQGLGLPTLQFFELFNIKLLKKVIRKADDVLASSNKNVSEKVQVKTNSNKSQKSRQGEHSNLKFLECCLKNADDPPGGASPPLGDPCILSQPRNSNFE